jgi:hypothetical protein
MLYIFSTPVLIRHLWQLKKVAFLHWCLIRAALYDKISGQHEDHRRLDARPQRLPRHQVRAPGALGQRDSPHLLRKGFCREGGRITVPMTSGLTGLD